MNKPNSLTSGEQQDNNPEANSEKYDSFEKHMEKEGLERKNDEKITQKTPEEKAEELASLRSNVMSQYKEEQSIKTEAEVPKAKREKAHDPDSEEITRDPGTKAMSEEAVKHGRSAQLAMTIALNTKLGIARRTNDDVTAKHIGDAQEALTGLIDKAYPDVVEPGEGTLGKLQVIEKALSRDAFSELLENINTPVMEGYKSYEAAVKAQLEQTKSILSRESSYTGSEYTTTVNGKKVSSSFKKGAEDIAKGMLTVKHPSLARRTPSEVLAQEDEDNRLRSDDTKTLEAFRVAVRDKKTEPTRDDRKMLDKVTEIENVCNQLFDIAEARSMCYELRKDLNGESGVDFSKAVKTIAKIEKKLAKQEKKLQKSIKKIDFGSLQSRVNAVA
ncbi:hypothetical protein IKG45_02135 [Candidatus Saccharibacteria bacterium]|nr:hypothetical protein [Candidatus Saccharibacteria bacterium]